jgi:hypothetical protein
MGSVILNRDQTVVTNTKLQSYGMKYCAVVKERHSKGND